MYRSQFYTDDLMIGAEETSAISDHAPEEAGGRAHHHRGQVWKQEKKVSTVIRRVQWRIKETLCKGTC